jgi:hypothetical protein
MVGAPKGNKNALKHGLYAGRGKRIEEPVDGQVRKATFAILHLEQAIEAIYKRMMKADRDEFTRLANTLSLATTALFNGHRTLSYLTGGMTPMEEALRELRALDFSED